MANSKSQGLLERSSCFSATGEEFTPTRFSTSPQTQTDKRGQGSEKQGGINRKGRYERRRNERRRREREEEFLHVETGSRALHH